ncbi:MAG: hypothetical protein INR66_12435 [Gordonia polyisoprenivorans]|nr:hypothetical protein [Gordonia polyisoprenivorans]
MSLRNRLAALALAVGATLSLGLAAAPAATAATTTKTFDISGSTMQQRRCEFGSPKMSGDCRVSWNAPYSPEWRAVPDSGIPSGFTFTAGEPTTVTVFTTTAEGRRISVEGTIPNRGSGDFTITKFDDPYFGSVAAGQKLNLRVDRYTNPITDDTRTSIYLNGHLNVTSAPTSGNGGGGLLSGLGGLFGSS